MHEVTATGASETGSYSLSYANNASGAPLTNRISAYTYDAAGNVLNDGGVYTYDAASRMKTAGGTNYGFDGDGNRVSARAVSQGCGSGQCGFCAAGFGVIAGGQGRMNKLRHWRPCLRQ
jgi:hypothetical protein